MAPLPDNNTDCYFVDYSVGGVQHTAQVRTSAGVIPTDFGTTFNAVIGTMDSLLYELTIGQVRFRAEGSNISMPVDSGIEGNVYGSTAQPTLEIPRFLNFVGRSQGGRRVTMALFGFKASDDFYRLTGAESTDLQDAIDLMNSDDDVFQAIDDTSPVWYPYANWAWSAYWQRKIRSNS